MTPSEKVRQARMAAGLTQAKLAEKMGVSPQCIAQWESGRRTPRPYTLKRVAEALNIEASILLSDYLECPASAHPTGETSAFTQADLDRLKDAAQAIDELKKTIEQLVSRPIKQQDAQTEELLKAFGSLNAKGKELVLDYANLMAGNPLLQQAQESQPDDAAGTE